MERVDALIIARGGSKRIPRKNLVDICGLPLVAWSIIQAKTARLVDEVWVSTDDDEIQEVSEKYGARVIRRPEWMMDDKYSGGVPTRHGVRMIKELGEFDAIMSILPTSPLRMPGDMDRTIEVYRAAPDPEFPVRKSAMGMARMHDVSKFIDQGDGTCTVDFIDKTNTALLMAGLIGVQDGQALLDYYDYMQEKYGVIHDTDERADASYLKGEFDAIEYTRQYFVEMQPWQIYELDVPEQLPLFRDMMEFHIMQKGGVELYEKYKQGATE